MHLRKSYIDKIYIPHLYKLIYVPGGDLPQGMKPPQHSTHKAAVPSSRYGFNEGHGFPRVDTPFFYYLFIWAVYSFLSHYIYKFKLINKLPNLYISTKNQNTLLTLNH